MSEAKVYTGCGVASGVLFAQPRNHEVAPPDMQPFRYRWTNTAAKQSGTHTVYCYNRADFLKLVASWQGAAVASWEYDAEGEEEGP